MSMFGGARISTTTVIGLTPVTTVGFGVLFRIRSASTAIGRRIVTEIGPGVRRMVGRGLDMSHGDGRLITTAAGFTTMVTGPGVRAANSIDIAVGGVRRWLHSFLTSHLAITSAGIR